jgi:hypothetical protein
MPILPTGPIRLATNSSSSYSRFQPFQSIHSSKRYSKIGETHVPLNAPTGLRTGAATTSIIRCEVWKPRRAVEVEIWVAGRAKAALRSAEGMRKAMLLCVLLGSFV